MTTRCRPGGGADLSPTVDVLARFRKSKSVGAVFGLTSSRARAQLDAAWYRAVTGTDPPKHRTTFVGDSVCHAALCGRWPVCLYLRTMARSGLSMFNTVRAASKYPNVGRSHSHESDGPGYPFRGRLIFLSPSIFNRPFDRTSARLSFAALQPHGSRRLGLQTP